MSQVVFETRAIPVWHIIIFAVLSFYVAVGIFALVSNIAGWSVIFIYFGSLFLLFLFSILFSKLEVYEDGISFRMYFVSYDEIDRIKLRWGGRLMTYGKRLDLGYILLNPTKFVEAVKAVKPEALTEYRKPIRNWRSLIYSLIPLGPMVVLAVTDCALRSFGIVINPFAWALTWGTVAALSTAAWTYWLPPQRYRIFGLGRLGTSITLGLAIGIPMFLIMLTRIFM